MNYHFEDPEIRRLKNELDSARRTIIQLGPPEFSDESHSYHRCETRSDLYKWRREMIEKVTALAVPSEQNSWEQRANCPLCGRASQSPYVEGFKLPLGLERHLEGYGNVRQCGVMHALFELADDYLIPKFVATEKLEREKAEQEIARRKTVELLYQIDPCDEPQLIDEGYHYGKSPRNEEGMRWAEQRLTELGFRITTENNVKRFICEMPNYSVFADPRMTGEITFKVYKAPLPKRRNPRLRSRAIFSIPDSWKNNLRAKFTERLPGITS